MVVDRVPCKEGVSRLIRYACLRQKTNKRFCSCFVAMGVPISTLCVLRYEGFFFLVGFLCLARGRVGSVFFFLLVVFDSRLMKNCA